ncbi:hypothetical protein [Fimbriiglobus ruber]|uniref:Uncharacterized protein n=1 Tax=Fimbriiglobus ruber TaxID=1908690 RepID=A0A225D109_9BACT|nr:hypothetical protein [Fimbriiglobus ruber]OWK35192.1 hypothetical protein FRUB_10034 [Fimbriiglobus ruber]
MTQSLIEKLENLKYHRECGNKNCEAYFAGVDDAIAIVRQHQAAPVSLEVCARVVKDEAKIDDGGTPRWSPEIENPKEVAKAVLDAAGAAYVD